MSVYANVDTGGQMQLASNSGWSAAGNWIDELDEKEYGELVHLWEHAWSDNGPLLHLQITTALHESPPDPDTQSVMRGLAEFAATAEHGDVLTVSNGAGPGIVHDPEY